MTQENKSFLEKAKERFKNASQNKKLAIIGMVAALLAGIVFLIIGNSTYFYYSAICFAVIYIFTRNIK